jgi:hypothetical protein
MTDSLVVKRLDDLLPDEQNANQGTDRGRALLDKSLRDFGAGRSILLDKNGRVIAGNKTREQAAEVGIQDVIVVQTDGSQLVAVQRTDLDLTTDPKARALAYADNRVAELDLSWKVEQIVKDVEAGVDLSGLFYDDELDAMVNGLADDAEKEKAKAEEAMVPDMALQPFEHYDYVVLVCQNTFDWTGLVELLGLEKQAVDIGGGRRKIGMCRVVNGARCWRC